MRWKERSIDAIARMICGDGEGSFFPYRSSSYLTRFFADADTDHSHDGSTRAYWVAGVLKELLNEPHPDAQTPPASICRVIATLMDVADATNDDAQRGNALAELNKAMQREGFEAFYAPDKRCYLRHIGTGAVAAPANPHRPFSKDEIERRDLLAAYLDRTSEDALIDAVLLPLFRQLGFHRITVAGHKDKALEYGKDIWMRYTLPTLNVLYFGIQVKRDKLDAAGVSKGQSANIAEVFNQISMMLGHEIFDPETNRRVLVDHAFIVSSGEITKAARNWLGNKLDQSKRSQIMFFDRDDLLNLFAVTNLALPPDALPPKRSLGGLDDDIPL